MKKLFLVLGMALMISFVYIGCEKAQNTVTPQEQDATLKAGGGNGCTTIQSGLLVNSAGETIETGYNDFGYNYQARIYNGDYGYGDGTHLIMKWNDAWLSNKDCDDDGLLDRHLGFDSYIGSGAWLTNHWAWDYIDEDGNECHATDFIKIVAAPADATVVDGFWVAADGTEIGEVIWGDFAIIQYVLNDPCAGINGIQYNSPDHPGLGNW